MTLTSFSGVQAWAESGIAMATAKAKANFFIFNSFDDFLIILPGRLLFDQDKGPAFTLIVKNSIYVWQPYLFRLVP